MLKPLLKKAISLLAMMPLLGACSMFEPKHKVIEYDEEVKLHNGGMIWVHIKRHYVLVGGALGDPGAFKKGYAPKEVEISWDTGFPNVGRKSLSFRNVTSIDKIQNKWFVFGGVIDGNNIKQSEYCKKHGLVTGKTKSGCLLGVNYQGEFFKPEINDLFEMKPNIFYPVQVKDWGEVPDSLDGTMLTWIDKINLQNFQPIEYRFVTNNPYTKEQFQ